MPMYSFEAALVLLAGTNTPAPAGTTGVLRPLGGGDPIPVYDMNDSPIPHVAVGPDGVHQDFRAEVSDGELDFGAATLWKVSVEQSRSGLEAKEIAQTAAAAAAAAASAVDAAFAGAIVVFHGAAPTTPRPDVGTRKVVWIGTVDPLYYVADTDEVIVLGSSTPDGPDEPTQTPSITRTTIAITSVTPSLDNGAGRVVVDWRAVAGNDAVALSGAVVCRDGVDLTNAGPWCSTNDPAVGSRMFYNLVPGRSYTFTVQPMSNGAPYGPVVTAAPVTIPATQSSALFAETFTAANGTAPDDAKWALGKNPAAGGSVVVQDNALRFTTGSAGGYSAADGVARRLVMTDVADFELACDFRFDGETFPRIWFRSNRTDEPISGTGYQINLGSHVLEYTNSWAATELAANTLTYTVGAWYTLRLRVVGTSIRARTWQRGTTEPAAWNFADATHSGKTAAGMLGVFVGGGGAGGQSFTIDNVTVTTPTGGGEVVTPPAPPAAGVGFLSGLSVDGVDATSTRAGQFYTWRGGTKPVGSLSTWADNSRFTSNNIWAFTTDNPSLGNFPGDIDLAIGGIYPGEGETWAQAAAGAYDNHFRTTFNIIAQYRRNKPGVGQTYVRPFHEFNGSWYPWAVHNATELAHFITVWRRIHAIKQELFPECRLEWSPNRETSGLPIKSTDAWPGDAYVDVVGVDWYFQWPGFPTQADWDAHLTATDGTGGPKGIEAWRQFALAHGKPISFPEWGTNSEPGVPAGPYPPYVDQPAAMTSFLNYCEVNQGSGAGQVLFANYFNAAQANDPYSGKFGLYPYTESPQAAAAYRAWHQAR